MAETSGVRNESVEGFLDRLASRSPTPGGGAVAALSASHAAALLGMGARFTSGPRHAEVAEVVEAVTTAADLLRDRALDLAVQDEQAFAAVSAAYALPQGDADARTRRATAIEDAIADAAAPPAEVLAVARQLVDLAERLRPVVKQSLLGDLAAAADAAYAAASTARVNIEANVGGLPAGDSRRTLLDGMDEVDVLLRRAVAVRESVREELCA